MNQWVNRKLREVGTLERGRSRHRPRYAFHLYNGPYPFIQTGEVRAASKYISSYENTYSEDGLKQSKLWPKGTLCITIAANIAELAILDFDACFPDSVLGFLPDTTKTTIDYVFYTLSHYQRRLKHIGEGSVQDNINLGTFENIEFPFPPLSEQKAIASVLSSLDDKIDLLHRQNKTLESMAETLFRQWFIEEAQDEWPEKSLNQYVELNKSSISKKYDFKEIQYLDTGSLTKGKISELQTMLLSEAPSRAKRLVNEFDIIISTVRPDQCHYGICIDPPSNLVVSTGFCVISGKSISPFFIYYLLTSEDMTEYLHSIAEGSTSTYPSLKPEDIGNVLFLYPGEEKLKNFHKLVGSYWNKIHNNYKKIQTLETLRDTLLPKLMSGEVRVQYAEQAIASVA
ncbi:MULTISPECIES: restriction endonuclease subunit S [Dickeya]|uniref:restriction endonuclease subunit S n=1 Tax=Dickeya TaxID=204037 RepID=UPI0003A0F98D|nr:MULTISPECIES: restriction endonuclease subunit S [Dickeya]UGA50145.1 restriction endonuclease subunit S [Dickeya fangzhongdai]UWH06500.1 restriction endonuclease subunit S [Dickeya fangzhongdai]